MKKGIYIICIIYGLAEIITAQKPNGCVTPNNENGVCISVKKCKQLNNLLLNRRHINSVKNHLQKSFCGYDDLVPKLCCPSEHVMRQEGQGTNNSTTIIDPTNPLLASTLPSHRSCGKVMINSNTDRIVGRRPAKLGAWPWLVIIGYKSLYENHTQTHWGCGGSLITNRHVLTAAYCLDDFEELKPTVVRLGDLDLNPTVNDGAKPLEILIDSIITHDRYFDGGKIINNIGVLKLKESVTFNDYIQPICLPSQSNMNINYNKMSVVSGWGSIKPSETISPINPSNTKLMEVELPFIDNMKCKIAYANETRAVIDGTVLCAGFIEGKKDSCLGDIGGPLMLGNQSQYYAIGIVSYGPKVCGTPNKPGVYTSVPSFINWILRSLVNN